MYETRATDTRRSQTQIEKKEKEGGHKICISIAQPILDKMATIGLIKEAILALKDRTGSSTQAINKWLESEKKVSCFECF